ncbi:MAG TPA: GspE/PulE family protein [Candidatus Paceibacterota bacterium]|nr:GspE/PulE family protein [Candidatus Paceibacterota bacterium]
MTLGRPDIPTFDLEGKKVSFDVLKYVPQDSAAHYRFVPVGIREGVLEVGMVDPENMEARDALQFIASRVNLPFKIYRISQPDFEAILKTYSGLGGAVDTALEELDIDTKTETDKLVSEVQASKEKNAPASKAVAEPGIIEEAPVTKIVAVILQHATSGNASDIHIEPIAEKVRVRFRVDGALYTSLFLPITVHEAIVARIKILTNMKLDEKRKPQDGRFSAKIEGRKIDFRVSTLPTYFGEKVVLRILDPDSKLVQLETLGFRPAILEAVKRGIERPYGLILVTGPTGSGKTTTLYSMLNAIDKEEYNAVSLEDPIEFDIAGVNQSQVQPEINYTFANGLRSILRQDPDIIMVGEIRDKETARLAIQAALTGHLVFSTLHTNNSIGAIPRLIDMGVDPYLIPTTLIMAIAQRLVPKLCEDSKQAVPVEGALRMMFEKQLETLPAEFRKDIAIPENVYQAVNSPAAPRGTKGRVAAAEFFEMDRELEKIILTNPTDGAIYDHVRSKGFLSMREDAMLKAFEGTIPFGEVNKL